MSRSFARARSGSRWIAVAIAALVVTATVPGMVAAEPAQSVGDLNARAKQVNDRLESLGVRSSQLDEQYNATQLEIEALQRQLAEQQDRGRGAACAALDDHRANARRYAIDAYVSGGAVDELLSPGGDDSNLSRRRIYLSAVSGDRQQVIDDVSAAEADLADREAELQAKADSIESKRAGLESSKRDLESTIAEQEALQATVKGQLAQAVDAERTRREAADAARARDAATAAQRAAAKKASQSPGHDRASPIERARHDHRAEESDVPRSSDSTAPEAPVVFPDAGNAPPGAAAAIAARSHPARGSLPMGRGQPRPGLRLLRPHHVGVRAGRPRWPPALVEGAVLHEPPDLRRATPARRPRVRREPGPPRRHVRRRRHDDPRAPQRRRGADRLDVLHVEAGPVRAALTAERLTCRNV